MQWAAVNEHVYSPQKADNGIQDINGLFDYGIRIRIHNESESEVNPTPHSDPVIHCESWSGWDNRIAPKWTNAQPNRRWQIASCDSFQQPLIINSYTSPRQCQKCSHVKLCTLSGAETSRKQIKSDPWVKRQRNVESAHDSLGRVTRESTAARENNINRHRLDDMRRRQVGHTQRAQQDQML